MPSNVRPLSILTLATFLMLIPLSHGTCVETQLPPLSEISTRRIPDIPIKHNSLSGRFSSSGILPSAIFFRLGRVILLPVAALLPPGEGFIYICATSCRCKPRKADGRDALGTGDSIVRHRFTCMDASTACKYEAGLILSSFLLLIHTGARVPR